MRAQNLHSMNPATPHGRGKKGCGGSCCTSFSGQSRVNSLFLFCRLFLFLPNSNLCNQNQSASGAAAKKDGSKEGTVGCMRSRERASSDASIDGGSENAAAQKGIIGIRGKGLRTRSFFLIFQAGGDRPPLKRLAK